MKVLKYEVYYTPTETMRVYPGRIGEGEVRNRVCYDLTEKGGDGSTAEVWAIGIPSPTNNDAKGIGWMPIYAKLIASYENRDGTVVEKGK